MNLQSYVCGAWHSGRDGGVAMRDATTGEVIAHASSTGIDFAAVLDARPRGGRTRTARDDISQRAGLLRAMAKHLTELKEEFYALSYRTGATKNDSLIDIDGGIGTVFVFAGKGSRELPNARVYVDGDVEALSKGGSFVGQHILRVARGRGGAHQCLQFSRCGECSRNWRPRCLAGMPAIVKPATATAYLTELVVRRIIESKILPEGALQLVCGSLGDLFDHLNCQDAVSFTGSAHTAARLRVHPAIIRHAVPFIAETDSLNSSILAPDAVPGTPEFDLFVKEVVREMTVKAGQKCTAIRKALVPAAVAGDVVERIAGGAAEDRRGRSAGRRRAHGSLGESGTANRCAGARRRATRRGRSGRRQLGSLRGAGSRPRARRLRAAAAAALARSRPRHAPSTKSRPSARSRRCCRTATPPMRSRSPAAGRAVSAASVFSADDALAGRIVLGLAPYHGRILVVNRSLRQGVHRTWLAAGTADARWSGPRRRRRGDGRHSRGAALHAAHRRAGSPDTLTAVSGRWVRGSRLRDPGRHPFRIPFHDLELGDTLKSAEREVTVADIEQFAALVRRQFLRPYERERPRREIPCSAAASPTATFSSRPRRVCSSIRSMVPCSATTASMSCAS